MSVQRVLLSRRMEVLELLLDVECANEYDISSAETKTALFSLIEERGGFKTLIVRNILRRRRPLKAKLSEANGTLLTVINRKSKIIKHDTMVMSPSGECYGIVKSKPHLFRRRYTISYKGEEYAKIDERMLSFHFRVVGKNGNLIAKIDRKIDGLLKAYLLNMGDFSIEFYGDLSFEEKALIFALALSIDVDYSFH